MSNARGSTKSGSQMGWWTIPVSNPPSLYKGLYINFHIKGDSYIEIQFDLNHNALANVLVFLLHGPQGYLVVFFVNRKHFIR